MKLIISLDINEELGELSSLYIELNNIFKSHVFRWGITKRFFEAVLKTIKNVNENNKYFDNGAIEDG